MSDMEAPTKEGGRKAACTAQLIGRNMLQPQLSIIGASVQLTRKPNSLDWHSVVAEIYICELRTM
jgi:hypothetical protein